MKNRLFYSLVIIQVPILSFISTCQGQSSFSNSTSAFLHSNHSIEDDALNNNLEHSNNNTHQNLNLDKLFGVDRRIFEEYLKDEDLRIIPGFRDDDDFDNWIPPQEISRDLPIYMSGFDHKDRPIWIFEWGKWRFEKYATNDAKQVALFDKYLRYVTLTYLKSLALRSTKEKRIKDFISVLDYDGFMPASVLNRKILQLQVKVFSNYRRFAEKYMAKSIAINVNPIAEVLLNLIRPYFSLLLGRFEVYGTNKYIWGKQFLNNFPKDQIPEWYGGNKGFVPFLRFG